MLPGFNDAHVHSLCGGFAEFAEDKEGTLAPGKLADIVILGGDIFTIKPEEIGGVRVLLTVMDGRVVFE